MEKPDGHIFKRNVLVHQGGLKGAGNLVVKPWGLKFKSETL